MRKRRTSRKFKQKTIPKVILNRILEAGRIAPSAHNSQPWFFVVLSNKEFKQKLQLNLMANTEKFVTSANIMLKKALEIMSQAPCVIFVYNTKVISRKLGFMGRPYTSIIDISEIQSIAAAIQNMHLVASALNIGFAWLVFPLLLEKQITKLLNTNYKLTAILALGYPLENAKPTTRKKLKEIVKFI